MLVGGSGPRGVVAAASYEARAFGVHSAMPSTRARRRCPDAVFLPADHGRYAAVSRELMTLFTSYTPLVEPLSLDEAFLDVSGAGRLFGPPEHIAADLRRRVWEDHGLGCSVGVAPNKLLAKLGSEAAKPSASAAGPKPGPGVVVIRSGDELAFLHPHPVRALWGVGPATHRRLARLGVRTIGDLAGVPLAALAAAVGRTHAEHLHRLARGIDERPVVAHQPPKSVGNEETFPADHHDRDSLRPELVRLADATAARLRALGVTGRTVTIKVRFHDFRTVTRSVTLADPVSSGPLVARAAKALLDGVDPAPGVRLIGVSVTGLAGTGDRQLRMQEPGEAGWDEASAAVDDIRRRFGDRAVVPGASRCWASDRVRD